MREFLMEPLKYYESRGKAEHTANAEAYFGELLKRSGVNVEQNRASVKRYHQKKEQVEQQKKKIGRYKTFRVLFILLAIFGGLAAIYGIASIWWWIPIGVAAIAGSLLAVFLWINPAIKSLDKVLAGYEKEAELLLAECQAQMVPLNALFDSTDTLRLIEKTMPEIVFEPAYSKKQEELFKSQNDFCDAIDPHESVIDTLSGELCGNPFLFYRYRSCDMGLATYSGSITISWTETYRDSKGNLRTRRRSQVLTATVEKPKPYYSTHTALGYGCQAAPDLSFTRRGTHSEQLDEKALERKIRKGAKKLREKAEDALEQGRHFQEMANTEFDVLFGAHDRDHEVQFRLMYTPLAQQNTVDLLTSKSGYGDDFSFIKQDRYNVILSEHAVHWSMESSPSHYYSYDVDAAKKNFISFNDAYFKSVFFDLAPLMAVPAYMSEPVRSMEEPPKYETNYTYYEHEVLANALGGIEFAHRDSATEPILKTAFAEKRGDTDIVNVTAYSHRAVERVDFVTKLGGDGHIHSIPVPWTEYIPVEHTRPIAVKSVGLSEKGFREDDGVRKGISSRCTCIHGLMAYIYEQNT